MNIIFRNNTGNKSKSDLINGFVIRTKAFKGIYDQIITDCSLNKSLKHFLIIGQRGAGKTTLVCRLKYAIEDNLTLDYGFLPIMLSEEQYNLSELSNLWENVAELLEEANYFPGLRSAMEKMYEDEDYEQRAFDLIEKTLQQSGKRLILFIENIDVFLKKIGGPGQVKFRNLLSGTSYLSLIATSTNYFQAISTQPEPFFGFFEIIKLLGLSKKESIELLLKIGDEYGQRERIESVIRKNPTRVESLRRLTGGIPRTISYLFQIFLDNANGKAIMDLHQIIDTFTFLYKSELDQLTAQQQKVVDVIAKNWDAIGVKDISAKTRYESKQVSSILQLLEKNQVIETISTKNKNNLYRIRERFMNIWYLMRFGKKHEKENVIWLVRFFDTWCDKTELAQQINNLIKNITDGKYDHNAALYMGNTFLACENVSGDLKYHLYKTTKEKLPRELITDLRYSYSDQYERVNKLVKEGKYDQAIEFLTDIPNKDDKWYQLAYFTYVRAGENVKAEIALTKLFELNPQDKKTAFRLGYFYDKYFGKTEKAIEYYKIALELGEFQAALMLGRISALEENWKLAEHYTLLAADNNVRDSFLPLATVYFNLNNLDKAEEYAKRAVDAKVYSALINLGSLYEKKEDYENAEMFYKTAVSKNIHKAFIALGNLEMTKPEPNILAARDYFQSAYEKKVDRAGYYLGSLLIEHFDSENNAGVRYLIEEVKKKNATAAHRLGHYFEQSDYQKADEYFLEAFRLGRKSALLCYVNSFFGNGRRDKKKRALEFMEEKMEDVKLLGIHALIDYACVLLWNDKVDLSLDVIKNQLLSAKEVFGKENENEILPILRGLMDYFLLLMTKGLYKTANVLFEDSIDVIDLKQVLKPVYFALMKLMMDEFPKEYLKAGEELQDTINEIIETIKTNKKKI